jgi:hypothetical protein
MEKRSSSTSSNTPGHGIADVTPSQLASRVASITKHLDAIDALLSDAKPLTNPSRKSVLRLRGDEEVAALSGIIAFADMHAELFTTLAGKDEGVDPTRFETELLATRLANTQTLSALATRVEQLQKKIADSALYTTALVKPPVLAAWKIAKPFQGQDLPGDELLAPAVNFYSGVAIKAAHKRAQKAATAATVANATTEPEK